MTSTVSGSKEYRVAVAPDRTSSRSHAAKRSRQLPTTRRRKQPVHDFSVVILPLGHAPKREPEPEPVFVAAEESRPGGQLQARGPALFLWNQLCACQERRVELVSMKSSCIRMCWYS